MTGLDPEIERELRRAQGRWRSLRFLRWTSILACVLSAAASALALVVHRGYLQSAPLAAVAAFAVLSSSLLAFFVVCLVSMLSRRPRPWLAATLERSYDPLLDRLNALVHLEAVQDETEVWPYFRRIERQAVAALPASGLPSPFPRRGTLFWTLAAVLAITGTVKLYSKLEPWERLSWNAEEALPPAEPPDPGASLEAPPASAAEVKGAWGEVRITEPGRDLKVTKVDAVPLQVEAASDQPLKAASWSTATNGAGPSRHDLPPPAEPNYAVYKPLIYVDELGLQDWDVVSYFASASTAGGASYASEIYFLEVRPFREDLAKMPGGEGGKAFAGLNELTGLIERQRQILRETHRFQQSRDLGADLRRQDRGKLAGAESDLGDAVRHLYAKLAAEMENQPIGDVLTHLAASEGWIEKARLALLDEAPEAMAKEQGALAELVATRKSFQKVVTDHPEAFAGDDAEGEDTPAAELPDKLKQILELRDQEQAARELVKRTLDAQRALTRRTTEGESDLDTLAGEQRKLAEPLRDLKAAQPQAFRGAEKEAEAAVSALVKAAKALEDPDPGKEEATAQRQAITALEKLHAALGEKRLAQELGHAYRLKEVLDREAEQMGRMQAEPSKFSGEQAGRTAADAKSAANGLKKIVEEKPGKDAFGPELGKALQDKPLRELESRLDALARSQGEAERGAAAGRAREALGRVAQAFEQSQPPAVKELKADRLSPGEEDSLDSALTQLDSLVARPESERRPTPEDEARQRRELLLNLRKGLEGMKGDAAKAARLLLRVEEALAKDLTPEQKLRLKKLREEIEQYRVELKDRGERAADKALVTRVDPARLPAAYRDRIQRYFRKLSEQ